MTNLNTLKLFFAATMLAPAIASASPESDIAQSVQPAIDQIEAASKTCFDKATSNEDKKACQETAWEASDALLNKTYQAIVDALKARSAQEAKSGSTLIGTNKTYSQETLDRMVASERDWIKFRDSECNFEGTEMLGGTGEPLVYSGCETKLTEQRILDLSSTASGQDN